MKRTKNLIYNETIESRELMLYTVNDGELYRGAITAVINNLKKHALKGLYNTDRAIDAWYTVATQASAKYNKDFGYSFGVRDRFTVADELEQYFIDEVSESLTSFQK